MPPFPGRINRYIMECKFRVVSYIPHGYGELIDTLWNVNHAFAVKFSSAHYRINRYIMECKSAHLSPHRFHCSN